MKKKPALTSIKSILKTQRRVIARRRKLGLVKTARVETHDPSALDFAPDLRELMKAHLVLKEREVRALETIANLLYQQYYFGYFGKR